MKKTKAKKVHPAVREAKRQLLMFEKLVVPRGWPDPYMIRANGVCEVLKRIIRAK